VNIKSTKYYLLTDYNSDKAHAQSMNNDEIKDAELLKDIIEILGPEELKAIQIPEQIKCEIKFNEPQEPHIYFQYIKGFISALVTEDPIKVHYDIVRAALKKIDENLLENKHLIDMMARELIEQCRKLKLLMIAPKQIQPLFDQSNVEEEKFPPLSGRTPLMLKITKLNITTSQEVLFESGNMFIWDQALISVLKNTGAAGTKAVKECYKEALQKGLSSYKSGHMRPVDFWFNTNSQTPEEPFHASPALQILTKYIYEDIVKKREQYGKKYPAALPNTIHYSVNIIHKGEIKETSDQIQIFNDGSLIGSLPIAAIDPNLYGHVLRGADKFGSVTSHRLIRFLPLQAHKQLGRGINPCNILTYSGGYAQIVEEIGLNGKKAISDIKDLLHGLAFMKWNFDDFSGNFIALGQYKQAITRNQNLGIKITLGPELSPYYASKHKLLLVPVARDPQLVGPTQYYSNLFLLQNEILAEFSNQSIRLAEEGVVALNEEIWELGKLPPKVKEKVQECWIQDGNDGEKFLEKIDKNIYTLGPSYHKELQFLKEQGERRKQRSREALRAIEKKRR
jgi:hypothetical protein